MFFLSDKSGAVSNSGWQRNSEIIFSIGLAAGSHQLRWVDWFSSEQIQNSQILAKS